MNLASSSDIDDTDIPDLHPTTSIKMCFFRTLLFIDISVLCILLIHNLAATLLYPIILLSGSFFAFNVAVVVLDIGAIVFVVRRFLKFSDENEYGHWVIWFMVKMTIVSAVTLTALGLLGFGVAGSKVAGSFF